jgi:hypothetical protein
VLLLSQAPATFCCVACCSASCCSCDPGAEIALRGLLGDSVPSRAKPPR